MAYARGYNDWLNKKYLSFSPKLKGVALIPMQDVPSAVAELRRAVKDLGMLGAMLPSNGLRFHLGAKEYWPVYEEAEKLDRACGARRLLRRSRFQFFRVFPATRALGMPFPLAIAATGMIVEGMLDQFPKLRIGFLEGGTAWIPIVIDRLDRELEYGGLHLKASRKIISKAAASLLAAKAMKRRSPTPSSASDHNRSCSHPIFRTRFLSATAWRKSTRSSSARI